MVFDENRTSHTYRVSSVPLENLEMISDKGNNRPNPPHHRYLDDDAIKDAVASSDSERPAPDNFEHAQGFSQV